MALRAVGFLLCSSSLGIIGCVAPTTVTATSESSDSTVGDSSDSDSAPVPATGEVDTSNGTSSSDAADSSSGADAACGNGVIDDGESCEGDEACVDCRFACALEQIVDLDLASPSYIKRQPDIIAWPDGSGDLAVGTWGSLYRVAATGDTVSAQTSLVQDNLFQVVRGVDDDLWVSGATGHATWTGGAVTRHSFPDFEQVGAIDFGEGRISPGDMVIGPTGRLLIAAEVDLEGTRVQTEVIAVSPEDGAIEWRTVVIEQHGYTSSAGTGEIGVTADGDIYWGGSSPIGGDINDLAIRFLLEDGTPVWSATTALGEGWNQARSVAVLSDASAVVLVAHQELPADWGFGNIAAVYTGVLRISREGTTIWQIDTQDVEPSGRAQFERIAVTTDDRIVLAGAVVDGYHGSPLIAQLDRDGEVLCAIATPHASGTPAMVNRFYVPAGGGLAVSGFLSEPTHELTEFVDGRFVARLVAE